MQMELRFAVLIVTNPPHPWGLIALSYGLPTLAIVNVERTALNHND